MKKILSLFLFVALSASATAPATVTVPDASLGAVDYDVCYRLAGITTKVATATVTFVESEWDGKPAYHSLARIVTQPFFRLFLKAEYRAEAWYAKDDLKPLCFVHPFKEGNKEGLYEVSYEYGDHVARSSWAVEGREPVRKTFEIQGGKPAMELLSALTFVRFHDFKDAPETVTLIMPSKARDAGIGMKDDHILLQISGNGVMENGSGNTLRFWRSPAPDRRILRLEADLSSGSLRCTVKE